MSCYMTLSKRCRQVIRHFLNVAVKLGYIQINVLQYYFLNTLVTNINCFVNKTTKPILHYLELVWSWKPFSLNPHQRLIIYNIMSFVIYFTTTYIVQLPRVSLITIHHNLIHTILPIKKYGRRTGTLTSNK